MTMFVQKVPHSMSLVRETAVPASPVPVTFTEGEIYGPSSPAPLTGTGSLALGISVALSPGSTAAGRYAILLLQFSGATRPPVISVIPAVGAPASPAYLFQGDNQNLNYLLKLFFSHATTSFTITNSAENSALTVVNYNIKYGNEGIFLPKGKFII